MSISKLGMAAALLASSVSFAQRSGPYSIRTSEEFESPKGHVVLSPISYGEKGILQINQRGMKSFNFQMFSNDLKMQREKTIALEDKFDGKVAYPSMLKLRNKTYMFVRQTYRETKTEGVTALEFSPDQLDFVGSPKPLFQSSGRVRFASFENSGTISGYDMDISEDQTKFVFSYSLVPKEKRDKLNKDIIGIYTYDENLKQLWGDEFEMPYTEAKMDNLGLTVSDNGSVYMLARVYEGEDSREGRDPAIANFHFELLVYDKGVKTPKMVEMKLDNHFPSYSYIYEDPQHKICVAGFYSKGINKPVDGAFMVRLSDDRGSFNRVNGGYYEIPSDIIKSYSSDREKRKLERKEDKDQEHDLGVDNLEIRQIYAMPDGSTKIIAEQYLVLVHTYYDAGCKCTHTTYSTNADDIFVFSISAKGELDWVKKIPKSQHSGDAAGLGLSINTYVTGNDLHIFYIDNIKNWNLPSTEAPKRHENNRGGFLTAVKISPNGDLEKYNLGEVEQYETNFFIRNFVDGENNNLITTTRRKKRDIMFSLDIEK